MRRLLEECTRILQDFEESHEVESAAFGDIDIWPLMRLTFYHALTNDQEPGVEKEENKTRRKIPVGNVAQELDEWIAKTEETLGSRREIYFVQSTKVIQGRNGGPYHRFFDSLIELSESRDSAGFLFWNDGRSVVEMGSLRSPSVSYQELGRLARRWARSDDPKIESLKLNDVAVRLIEEWNRAFPNNTISIELFRWDCLLLQILEEAFKDFGDGFSPSGLATALRKAGRAPMVPWFAAEPRAVPLPVEGLS